MKKNNSNSMPNRSLKSNLIHIPIKYLLKKNGSSFDLYGQKTNPSSSL
jgi:hypothetical protein